MSTSRIRPKSTNCTLQLEPTAQQGHNGRHAHDSGKPDRRIVALVKLFARFAAEEDFRDDPHER